MTELETIAQGTETRSVICPSCGANVKEGAMFCSSCGRPMNVAPAKRFCACCGTELSDGEMFCRKCGAQTAESRDAQVLNSIAAYNNAIGQPKKQKSVKLKENSVFAVFTWLGLAIFAAIAGVIFLTEKAGLYLYTTNSIIAQIGPVSVSRAIPALAAAILFLLASLCTILFWKEKNKLRALPVVFSFMGSTAFALYFVGGWVMYQGREFLIVVLGALVMHVAALLFALNVIKQKTAVVITSIAAFVAAIAIPYAYTFVSYMSGFLITGVTSIPMLLLTFACTSDELKDIPKKKVVLRKVISIILVILIIFASIAGTFLAFWVRVGDVVGMTVYSAKMELSRFNVTIKREYNDSVKKDNVISQSIPAGDYVIEESAILLTVSRGVAITVPEVANLSLDAATKQIEELGLKVNTKYEYSSTVSKNKVIRAEEKIVEEGATVTVVISKGKDNRITIPDVSNLSESDAKTRIQRAGAKVKVVYVYTSCDAYKTQTKVIYQSSIGKVEPGTTITIQVAKPSISITRVNFNHNSVGGVNVTIDFKNLSNKQIKYVEFGARFKNAVGDNVYCSIQNTSTMNLEYTGPLNGGSSESAYWSAVIYNWNCEQIHFDKIVVTFMDGTEQQMTYNGYWYN